MNTLTEFQVKDILNYFSNPSCGHVLKGEIVNLVEMLFQERDTIEEMSDEASKQERVIDALAEEVAGLCTQVRDLEIELEEVKVEGEVE